MQSEPKPVCCCCSPSVLTSQALRASCLGRSPRRRWATGVQARSVTCGPWCVWGGGMKVSRVEGRGVSVRWGQCHQHRKDRRGIVQMNGRMPECAMPCCPHPHDAESVHVYTHGCYIHRLLCIDTCIVRVHSQVPCPRQDRDLSMYWHMVLPCTGM
jgi:hypothetical protein